jgi:hypothetical protein
MVVQNKCDEAVEAERLGMFPPPTMTFDHPRSCSAVAAAASRNAAYCHLYKLPDEILCTIAENLDLSSAIALSFTSKRFYRSRLWEYSDRSSWQGITLAKEFGCPFLQTSAKTGVNVNRAFIEIVRMLRQQEQDPEQLAQLEPPQTIAEAPKRRGTRLAAKLKTILRRNPTSLS